MNAFMTAAITTTALIVLVLIIDVLGQAAERFGRRHGDAAVVGSTLLLIGVLIFALIWVVIAS